MNWMYLLIVILFVWLVVLTYFFINDYYYDIIQDERIESVTFMVTQLEHWSCKDG